MLVKTFGSAVYGVEAITIAVEVSINNQGKSEAVIVGLPDSAVKESLLRVESAIKDNGYFMPRTRLIVNLAPADIRKSGTWICKFRAYKDCLAGSNVPVYHNIPASYIPRCNLTGTSHTKIICIHGSCKRTYAKSIH